MSDDRGTTTIKFPESHVPSGSTVLRHSRFDILSSFVIGHSSFASSVLRPLVLTQYPPPATIPVMRILLTGATGFAGGHLAEALAVQPGVELLGVSRGSDRPAEWKQLNIKMRLRPCDFCNRTAVAALLKDWRPDAIYHLAGYAQVGRSFREPDLAWEGNLSATRN